MWATVQGNQVWSGSYDRACARGVCNMCVRERENAGCVWGMDEEEENVSLKRVRDRDTEK